MILVDFGDHLGVRFIFQQGLNRTRPSFAAQPDPWPVDPWLALPRPLDPVNGEE